MGILQDAKDKIVERELPISVSDHLTQAETFDYDSEQLKGIIQDRRERKRYADRIFYLIMVWLIAIFVFLILQGFAQDAGYAPLSDAVLITLLGTTTATVLGLFALVTKYLFSEKRIQKSTD